MKVVVLMVMMACCGHKFVFSVKNCVLILLEIARYSTCNRNIGNVEY